MRETGPVHWFFRGDEELARAFLPEARKHLGVLAALLGDAPTGARSIRNKAGVTFRVARFGAELRVLIDTTGVVRSSAVDAILNGFVVYPSPSDLPATLQDGYVVLMPVLADWRSWFFEASDFPPAPTFPVGQYRTDIRGRPLFMDGTLNADALGVPIPPHADGLTNFGNVDWRNQDETLIVSWVGPACRYVNAAVVVPWYSHYLFFHGQQLFDCSALSAAGFFGDLSSYYNGGSPPAYGGEYGCITGACITAALDLLVFVRFGAQSIAATGPTAGTIRKEFLIRLQVDPFDARGEAGKTAATWRLRNGDGNPVVLWSQELPSDMNDTLHPWFFNQSGTEARCIRTSGPAAAPTATDELVIGVVQNPDSSYTATYGTISHGATASITTTVTTDTYHSISTASFYSTGEQLYNWGCGTCTCGDSGCTYGDFTSGNDWSDTTQEHYKPGDFEGTHDCWLGFIEETTGSDLTVPDQDWIVSYVDYRDDAPVYGYTRVPDTDVTTFDRVDSITGSNAVTNTNSGAFGGDITLTITNTESFSITRSSGETANSRTSGIMTDWMTVEGQHTINQSFSGTASFAGSGTGILLAQCLTDSGGGVCCYTCNTDPGESTYDATYDLSYNYVSADDNRYCNLIWLDLRYKWLCYSLSDDWTTLSSTLSDSKTTHNTIDSPLVPSDWTLSPVKQAGSTVDYYATLDGVELEHTTVTVTATTTTTGAGTGLPTSLPVYARNGIWDTFGLLTLVPVVLPACTLGDVSPTVFTGSGTGLPAIGAGVDATSHDWSTALVAVGDVTAPVTFKIYGSWQTYQGSNAEQVYAFSQAMPDGSDPTVPVFKFQVKNLTASEIQTRLRAPSMTSMHPIWVLPTVKS